MIVYQASPEQEALLERSLRGSYTRHQELFLCDVEQVDAYFFRNAWFNAEIFEFDSISQAAKHLRALGRNWAYFPLHEHRRASLIAEQLPKLPKKALVMPHPLPEPQLFHSESGQPIGSFSLLDKNHMVLAKATSSPFPGGVPHFQENKIDPPSRAYLKLWEALCILNRSPNITDHCLDLGACPGGWTWVLQHYAAKVSAVDRTPLHPTLMAKKNVEFIQGNAFNIEPNDFPELNWLVSDVICYPEKLLTTVQKWVSAMPDLTMICTLKFQGEADYGIVKEFLKIPTSRIVHLFHNKHELTWIKG